MAKKLSSEESNDGVDFKLDPNLFNSVGENIESVEEKTEEPVEEEKEENQQTESEVREAEQAEPEVQEDSKKESQELSREELVNQLLTDRFNLTLDALPEVLSNNENSEKESIELPEDVKKYLEYKKETNRPLSDFIKLQQNVEDIQEDALLKEYYTQTKPGLDSEDYDYLLDTKFSYNPENATEEEIRMKTLNKKEEIYKARQYFETLKDKYKTPLESSGENAPKEYKEAFSFYTQYKQDLAKQEESTKRQRDSFEQQTSKLFNQDFEGFDFKVGDKKLVYKPKNLEDVKSTNSDLNNFFSKHIDENGILKDAKAYHTALSMAMNPQSFASFFYEQGKADAVNQVVTEGKNIDMSVRNNVESAKEGPKFRVLKDNSTFGSKLKIKKR